jgi:type II secretory pathway pseudopilin PulG
MRSSANANRRVGGFTLVEVVVSVGVFSLVLVGGFAAVGTMLNLHRDIYLRTVSASLMMTLGDWRRQQAVTVQSTWTGSNILIAAIQPPTNTTTIFSGGVPGDSAGGTWYTVKQNSIESATEYNLTAYSDLIIKKSADTDESPDTSKYHAYYCVFTIWQGNAMEFNTANTKSDRRLRFLGRYVMPDGFN